MAPGMPSVNSKKMFAIVAVIILFIAAFALWNRQGIGPEKKKEGVGGLEGWPPENAATTTRNRDNNEPTIVFDPSDQQTIVTGSNDYNTPQGDAWVGYSTSHDGGKTWTEGLIPGYPGSGDINELTGFRGAGDPVLAAASDGSIYMAGIAFKRALNPLNPIGFGITAGRGSCIFVAKSTDHGDTFSQVHVVWWNSQNLLHFNDKEWLAVDPNTGNVYIIWAIFTALMVAQMYFSKSTDGGVSWSLPTVVTERSGAEFNVQGSHIEVDMDSNIHITWIDFGTGQIRYTKSLDEGGSWEPVQDIAPITPIPNALPNGNYRTPTMTMMDIDRSETDTRGSVYVVWADYSNGDADAFLVASHDNGESWGQPVRANNDTVGNGADQFFPDVSVSEEGWVHVTFYDRRNDTNNTMLEYWWAVSFDGGNNFSYNFPISDASFNGDYSRSNDNDFIGDYTGVDTINTTLGAVWCDTREASETTGDDEIYAAVFDYMNAIDLLGVEHPAPGENATSEK